MSRILYLLICFVSTLMFAQNETKELFEGNKHFEGKKFAIAEYKYRSGVINKEKITVSNYNLGNSIYRQNQTSEAKYKFYEATQTAKSKEEKHKAFHNLGNTLMHEKNYKDAVECYKNALRNNPYDEETRYNYALAKKLLKENPPQPPKNNEDKNNDKNKDQNPNQNDNQDNSDKNNNPKPSGKNKQNIDNILEAVNNAEKKVQEKVNAKKSKGVKLETDKDW